MNADEEKSFILKTAKMRLEKVEQRLKTLRSKQALKKCSSQANDDNVISRKISIVETAVDDISCGGDGPHFLKLEKEANTIPHIPPKEVISHSKDTSISAIHKARDVLNKLATYDKSSNLYSVFESLPHSILSNKNLSSGIERSGLKDESVENSSLKVHGNWQESKKQSHFSEISFLPKAEATNADRWQTKRLNHDLEKLFSLSAHDHNREEFAMREDIVRENVFSSIEDICWHLDCLSVETQWDSQFVDSMQVKRCHLEAVKDWRRQRPLDKLMSGSLRDFPLDISSLLLPCVVDDIIVCEVLTELQRSLSCQIEGSEVTKDLVDDMYQQLSYDLDLLTKSICSYEVQPNRNWRHKSELPGDSPILAKPCERTSSASTLLCNLEQQLGTIMNATSLGQSMADSAPKDLGLLSLSRTCKGDQKVDQKSDLLSESDLKSPYSPWDVMEPMKDDPVEQFHSRQKVKNHSKRSHGDGTNSSHDFRQQMTKICTNEFEVSSSNEDLSEDRVFINDKCRRSDSHPRNKKKLKSSRGVEGKIVDVIRMGIDAAASQNSGFQSPSNQECCDLINAGGNESLLPNDANFVQGQQPGIQQKSPNLPLTEQLGEAADTFEAVVLETNSKLLLAIDGAVAHYRGGVDSLITSKFGSACVGLSEVLQRDVNLSAPSLNSLKTSLNTQLKICRSNSRENRNFRSQFESFDKLCESGIEGGNLIVKSSAYTTERAKNREYRERRSQDSGGPRNREYGGQRNREYGGQRNRDYGRTINRGYGEYRKHGFYDSSRDHEVAVGKRQRRTSTLKKSEVKIMPDTNRLSSPEDVAPPIQFAHENNQQSWKVDSLNSPQTRQNEILSDVADVSTVLPDHKPISVEKGSKVTVQNCPRFMQTFRHSQIAKRKNQTSVLSSSILWPSEFPLPGSDVTESLAQNGSLTQTEGGATPSPDEVSSATSDLLYSIPLPTLPAAFSTASSTPVVEKAERVQERQSTATSLPTNAIDMFSSGEWKPITVNSATSSSLLVPKESPFVKQITAVPASTSVAVSTAAHLPFSVSRPLCEGVEKPENGPLNVNGTSPLRVYVFNQEKKECQLAKAALGCRGAITFDPYNVVLLRAIFPLECLVLVHSSDLSHLCRVSNLMRLKRDLRISFFAFDTVDEVLNRNFKPVYPRGGFVVIDTGTLIHCNSDHLEKLCQFMQKQANEKGIAWQLMISPEVANILNAHECEVQRTDQQLAKLADVIARYCSSGIIDIISTELFKRSKMSAFDYQQCCLALQVQNIYKYRHFLFLTDAVKQQVNVRGFTENGVDVMSIPEFLRGFVGCSVTTPSKLCKEYTSAISTEAFTKYIDSVPSSASETLMNKWSIPFSAPNQQ